MSAPDAHLREAWPAPLEEYAWLRAQISSIGIDSFLTTHPPPGDDPAGLIYKALRLSRPALATATDQFLSQLHGRLDPTDHPVARWSSGATAARRFRPPPTAPCSYGAWTNTGAVTPDGQRIVSGSADTTLAG